MPKADTPVVKTLRQSVKTAQAPGVGFALFVILLICLIALVAGFAFSGTDRERDNAKAGGADAEYRIL